MEVTMLISIGGLSDNTEILIEGIQLHTLDELRQQGVFDGIFLAVYGDNIFNDMLNQGIWAKVIKTVPKEKQKQPHLNTFVMEAAYEMRLKIMQHFNFLWFARDHSVAVRDLFAFVAGYRGTYLNATSDCDYESDGIFRGAKFTKEQSALGIDIQKKFYLDNKSHEITEEFVSKLVTNGRDLMGHGYIMGPIHSVHYDSYTRIERAFIFLCKARAIEFLPERISFYMPVLEALFATESDAVSFKIPLRIANYLGQDPDKRKYIFDRVSDAYNVRSRYLHGDELNKGKSKKESLEMKDYIPISQEIDKVTRDAFCKIILTDRANFLLDSKDERSKDGKTIIKEGFKSYLDRYTLR